MHTDPSFNILCKELENEIGELKQNSGCERVAKLEQAVMTLQTKNANLVNSIKEEKGDKHCFLNYLCHIYDLAMFE